MRLILRHFTASIVGAAALYAPVFAGEAPVRDLDLRVSMATRLLVIAPHPDDESVAAAGLIQRVHAAGGVVRAVVMTSGDALCQDTADRHEASAGAAEYRRFGLIREQETRRAIAHLGVEPDRVTFLGFPDDGLCMLASLDRGEGSAVLESPYRHRDEPPSAERIIRGVKYRGADVRRGLERILLDFRPTLVALPDPGDEHPDHCSTFIFVQAAIGHLAPSSAIGARGYCVMWFTITTGRWV